MPLIRCKKVWVSDHTSNPTPSAQTSKPQSPQLGTRAVDCRSVSCIFPMFPAVSCCSALGGGGGKGGNKNVIRNASMHKTLAFAVFSPLCTTHCARMWNKTRCHKRPCQLRRCPKHWYLRVFASLYNILRKDVEQAKTVTSVHAFC